MSTSAEALARRLDDIDRRLTAVERPAQMGRTSIEGGTLVVNDPDGTPVLAVGDQGDGTYAVAGANGGQVVANNLDVPPGTITGTDIAEDAISTPHLTANAIDGMVITGARLAGGEVVGGEVRMEGADGSRIRLYADPVAGASMTMLPGDAPAGMIPAALTTYRAADGSDVGTVLRGPAEDDGQGTPERGAEIILTGQSFNGTMELCGDYITVRSHNAEVAGSLLVGIVPPEDENHVASGGDLTVQHDLQVDGAATVGGALNVGGALTATGGMAVTGGLTIDGRNAVTGPGRMHWQTGTLTTNAQGIATFTHTAGFTPTAAVFVGQNGAVNSSAVDIFYVNGSATGTTFQVRAMLNGAPFVGSVGVTAILCGPA